MQEFQQRNTAPAGVLAQLAVPCTELTDFKTRKIENFTRWVQILVLKPKGQLALVQTPREEFVRKIAGSFAKSPPDMDALAKRIREHLAKNDSAARIASTKPIGATSEAFFVEIRGTAQVGSLSSPTSAVMAITTANHLPLGVYAFATPKAKGDSPAETLMAYLRSVIDRN